MMMPTSDEDVEELVVDEKGNPDIRPTSSEGKRCPERFCVRPYGHSGDCSATLGTRDSFEEVKTNKGAEDG